MNRYPKIKLSYLRDIGWKLWDPIGLGLAGEGWPEDCADARQACVATVQAITAYLEMLPDGSLSVR